MADFIMIPAKIAHDKDLPPNTKLLYGDIAALCKKNGYCWATNGYFAKLYNTTDRNIRRWLNSLEEAGYIVVSQGRSFDEKKQQRHIQILCASDGREDKNVRPDKNVLEGEDKNVRPTPDKNVRHNNTRYNYTSNEVVVEKIQSSNLVSIAPSGPDTATTIPQKVQDTYQQEIHPICSSFEQERLNENVERYGEETVIKAIRRAAYRGKRNLGYVEGILRRWETDGYDEEGNNGQGFTKATGKRQRKYDPEYERDKWAGETSGWK